MTLVLPEAALAVGCVQAAAVGGAWVLRSREALLRKYLPHLVSLAVGVLLTTALLDLMPEAVAQLGNRRLTWSLLGGIDAGAVCRGADFFGLDREHDGAGSRRAGGWDACASPCRGAVRNTVPSR